MIDGREKQRSQKRTVLRNEADVSAAAPLCGTIMCAMHVVATVAAASAFAPGLGGHAGAKPALSFRLQPQSTRTSIIALNDEGPVSYEEYLRARGGDANGADMKSAVTVSEATRDASPDALPKI